MSDLHEPQAEPEQRGFDRLTPLHEALAALSPYCGEIAPIQMRVESALDRIAAAPVCAPAAVPPHPIALCDGWAVAAQDTLGASPYAPGFASAAPVRVAFGDVLPDFANAVLPLQSVAAERFPAQILSPAAPGEGLRASASDFAEGEIIVPAGKRLRPTDLALLGLCGIEEVALRVPHVRIVSRRSEGRWAVAMAQRDGAECWTEATDMASPKHLAEAMARPNADLVMVIGAGGGASVARALASAGKLLVHGVAVRPGETMGCGILHRRAWSGDAEPWSAARGNGERPASGSTILPVIFTPERIECALAAWLLLARPCLCRLAGAIGSARGESLPLARKIVSNPGLSDLVLLRRSSAADGSGQWEPLATGDIPFAAIAHADAWLLVEPECEGYAAGQNIFAQFL
ncbi:hypothetical protein RZS28_15110 [Methylocapsa polymorpha]|uniref:Molybdopterin molybdenumtransferase n=1 Tax=Methylocapsa polymorpha TaxID=3080828 RepID=A0ABZ0HQS4_9HYPH|nr:hypothetical protein RZS28_15110 [Methylocapsa sp. RX1]